MKCGDVTSEPSTIRIAPGGRPGRRGRPSRCTARRRSRPTRGRRSRSGSRRAARQRCSRASPPSRTRRAPGSVSRTGIHITRAGREEGRGARARARGRAGSPPRRANGRCQSTKFAIQNGSATSGCASTRSACAGRSASTGRRSGPVSPASSASGARSPSRMCWSMWNEKRSSPSCAMGETMPRAGAAVRARRARSATAARACRAARASEPATPYATPTNTSGASWSGSSVQSPITPSRIARSVHLFHYHLVTSKVRQVEARYLGKLGFDLVARHGRIADD